MPPSAAHWFGTDSTGRTFFRVVFGARISLEVGVMLCLSRITGTLIGAVAGFYSGWGRFAVSGYVFKSSRVSRIVAGDSPRRVSRRGTELN